MTTTITCQPTDPVIIIPGKKFMFTGLGVAKGEQKNHPIVKELEEKGGLFRGSVSGVTDYLVVGNDCPGETKIQAAIEQKEKGKPIHIVRLADFEKALKQKAVMPEEKTAQKEIAPESKDVPSRPEAECRSSVSNNEAAPASRTSNIPIEGNWFVFTGLGEQYTTPFAHPVVQKVVKKKGIVGFSVSIITNYLVLGGDNDDLEMINQAVELVKNGQKLRILCMDDLEVALNQQEDVHSASVDRAETVAVNNEIMPLRRGQAASLDVTELIARNMNAEKLFAFFDAYYTKEPKLFFRGKKWHIPAAVKISEKKSVVDRIRAQGGQVNDDVYCEDIEQQDYVTIVRQFALAPNFCRVATLIDEGYKIQLIHEEDLLKALDAAEKEQHERERREREETEQRERARREREETARREEEKRRKARREELNAEKAAVQQELDAAKGLFAIMKRKKLQARIDEIDAQLRRI